MRASSPTLYLFVVCIVLSLSLSSCSMYEMTGDTMTSFAVDHALPQNMTGGDIEMSCTGGMSQAPLLDAFGRVLDEPPHRAKILTYSSSGMCAELQGWEAELARLRAVREGRTAEAQDARIVEKRAHLAAALRNQTAYVHTVEAYGEPGQGCPELETEHDELLYLLGLSSGLQSLIHDRAAEGAAGVSMKLPPNIARATECLNADKWWGLPRAMRAAIWTSIPGGAPDGINPWDEMEAAAQQGDAKGVGLARALMIQASSAAGRSEEMCKALEVFAKGLEETPRNKDYRLLDAYAQLIARHEVNKQWIASVGHRAPLGELACYKEESDDLNTDDLLDDLE